MRCNRAIFRPSASAVIVSLGCAALYSGVVSFLLLFLSCTALLLLLEARVKARLARAAGQPVSYPCVLYHALSKAEDDAAVAILSLLVSPLLLVTLLALRDWLG